MIDTASFPLSQKLAKYLDPDTEPTYFVWAYSTNLLEWSVMRFQDLASTPAISRYYLAPDIDYLLKKLPPSFIFGHIYFWLTITPPAKGKRWKLKYDRDVNFTFQPTFQARSNNLCDAAAELLYNILEMGIKR
jgi:hypothetical protein